jgi:hypothetical protein
MKRELFAFSVKVRELRRIWHNQLLRDVELGGRPEAPILDFACPHN